MNYAWPARKKERCWASFPQARAARRKTCPVTRDTPARRASEGVSDSLACASGWCQAAGEAVSDVQRTPGDGESRLAHGLRQCGVPMTDTSDVLGGTAKLHDRDALRNQLADARAKQVD